jgi:hypothetical protein
MIPFCIATCYGFITWFGLARGLSLYWVETVLGVGICVRHRTCAVHAYKTCGMHVHRTCMQCFLPMMVHAQHMCVRWLRFLLTRGGHSCYTGQGTAFTAHTFGAQPTPTRVLLLLLELLLYPSMYASLCMHVGVFSTCCESIVSTRPSPEGVAIWGGWRRRVGG